MLDDELRAAISKELPTQYPHLFFSAAAQKGLMELKDAIWEMINREEK